MRILSQQPQLTYNQNVPLIVDIVNLLCIVVHYLFCGHSLTFETSTEYCRMRAHDHSLTRELVERAPKDAMRIHGYPARMHDRRLVDNREHL